FTSDRRAMARTRAQAAERNLRHRDTRDHRADHGRGLLARSLLADLLARPAAPRDAAALLKWLKWATKTNRSRRRTSAGWSRCRSCFSCSSWLASGLSSAPIGELISRSFLNCLATTVKSKTRATSARASNRSGYPRLASPIAASRAISATNGLRFFRPRSPNRLRRIRRARGSPCTSSQGSDARHATAATDRQRLSRGLIKADGDGKIQCSRAHSRDDTGSR